ncbi:hypothetical protein COY87_02280 [Candidatus Roizmanbacteria bacterium CG_4_10_14_0_8_um_filter_33_9]|uniref:Membrane insertase YidC/Oxa/ALB C-terminal domain-containing protein n=1 Tax=Candidatus Roizmanbacteria bacterium CG_4_10_14_0_8_um_filter_33_9 TaxID=1974826 RepID=A0A2M7QK12_9BACT|nr:MAG: hypothetical protein COY87_02280 [Candidatus Roizmanbacteria bacterium CG_4_10_14_0_8_um_filter_33_9]
MFQYIGVAFETLFFSPIKNLLVFFYYIFLQLKLPGAFGFSIIALTIFVRLLLHPLFKQQMEMTKKMQDIKPHMDKLSAKHKKDPKKLQEEQLKLYQQYGINPASGCLFMIIQMPIFIALYQALALFFNGNIQKTIIAINKIVYFPFLKVHSIDPWFFGINLAMSPQKANNPFYYAVPIITAVLQYLQVQSSTPTSNAIATVVKDKDVKLGKKENKDDFQKVMNTQMKYVFPLMIGWFSMSLPIGLSLYWNIFSLFSIIQYRNIHKKKRTN